MPNSELYKKREREDLKKQAKIEAGRIQRVKGKRKQVSKKRIKTKEQQSVTPIVSESSGGKSSTREEEQVVFTQIKFCNFQLQQQLLL
ncbi:hypothetical protein HOY80DRAFT_1031470 [Tuber brumale]|nr:hypothetical protein HOY80DRAFT_1031470 [Tuber brumale]